MSDGRKPATPDERAEALRALGRYLHRERELRGLSLDDVARVTKLAAGVFESIESGEPERMPPRAYLVGYLRAYANATGLDPDEVVLRYQEADGPPETTGGWGAPGERTAARRRRFLVVVLVAFLVVLAIAAGMWRSGRGGGGEIRGRRSPERAPYRPADLP